MGGATLHTILYTLYTLHTLYTLYIIHTRERESSPRQKRKGKARQGQMEKGKGGRLLLGSNSCGQPDCTHERNETKRFPGWAHPPTSDFVSSVGSEGRDERH